MSTPSHRSCSGSCARPGSGPSRRTVLRTGGVAAGALALAGCGGDDASPAQTEADGSFRVPSGDTEVGGSTYYQGARIIVTQPVEGDFRAFDAVCPHEGCMTSETGSDGELVCPCHSSSFDPASGEVLSGPAAAGLTAMTVHRDGEDLLISG